MLRIVPVCLAAVLFATGCSEDDPSADKFQLTVVVSGDGAGTIVSTDGTVSCSASCSYSIASGTTLVLTAEADATYEFIGWSGACTGPTATCNLRVTAAVTVTGAFTAVRANNELDPAGDADADGLTNGEEAALGTSPRLSDTDGDGYSDYDEVNEYAFDPSNDPYKFNPTVADVPKIKINQVSPPAITLDMQSSVTSATTVSAGESRESSTAVTTSESTTNSTSIERTIQKKQHRPSIVGIQFPVGVNSTSYSQSTTEENAFTWSEQQTAENRVAYDTSTAITQEQGFQYNGGRMSVLIRVQNNGNIAFTLSNLVIGAVDISAAGGDLARPIGNLSLDSSYGSFPETTLGPGDSRDALIFEKDDLDLNTTLELLRDSRGLLLTATTYELTDAEGVSFNHNLTEVRAKTATVIIDYGPGTGRAPEYHMVATNIDQSALGITMAEALQDTLRIAYTTNSGLTGVRDVIADAGANKEWGVAHFYKDAGDEVVDYFSKSEADYDFGNIELKAGHVVHLFFLDDSDDDGLGRREEFMFGSDAALADSDSDTIGDGDEVFGMEVPGVTINDAFVTLNPAAADSDSDGFTDGAEIADRTDPTSDFPMTVAGGASAKVQDIAVDAFGNVYVVGYGTQVHPGTPNGRDWWVRKLDANGFEFWEKTFEGGFDGVDDWAGDGGIARAAALSPDGYLVVVGYHSMDYHNPVAQEYWWIKKLSVVDGAEMSGWSEPFHRAEIDYTTDDPAADSALAVAVDASSNVYVGGVMNNLVSATSGPDWVLKKFAPNGVEDASWNIAIDHGAGNDGATAVVVDAANNVYVGGYCTNYVNASSGRDWRIIKYDTNGTVIWDEAHEGGHNFSDIIDAMAVDQAYNVYVAGHGTEYQGQGTGTDWLVKKLASDGTDTGGWTRTVSGQGNSYDAPGAMILHGGNVYVVGTISPQYDTGAALRKWAFDGTEDQAARSLALPNVNQRGDQLYGIGAGPRGQFFIGGFTDEDPMVFPPTGAATWVGKFYDVTDAP